MRKFITVLILSILTINSIGGSHTSVSIVLDQKPKNQSKKIGLPSGLRPYFEDSLKFSEENFIEVLKILELDNIETVVKQSKLETGHYRSNLFLNYNNLFGMHYPYIRETSASGWVNADNNSRVSKYDSWQESVIDYAYYVKYWKSKDYCTKDYYKFLVDVGYCEKGAGYIKLLNKMS